MAVLYTAEAILVLLVGVLWYLCTSIIPTDSL